MEDRKRRRKGRGRCLWGGVGDALGFDATSNGLGC